MSEARLWWYSEWKLIWVFLYLHHRSNRNNNNGTVFDSGCMAKASIWTHMGRQSVEESAGVLDSGASSHSRAEPSTSTRWCGFLERRCGSYYADSVVLQLIAEIVSFPVVALYRAIMGAKCWASACDLVRPVGSRVEAPELGGYSISETLAWNAYPYTVWRASYGLIHESNAASSERPLGIRFRTTVKARSMSAQILRPRLVSEF